MRTRVLVPSGVLGLGFEQEALRRGLARQPDIICIDGGSTDSGPHYLGTGTSKYSREVCREEWRRLIEARAEASVPLVITSAGTCGTDAMVDWMYAMTQDILLSLNLSARIARIYSEQPPERLREIRVSALPPAAELDGQLPEGLRHVVALAGAEPIQHALQQDADIVISGRATDTAGIAALPLLQQRHPGAAWHGAKIAECGAFCTTQPASGVILLEVDAGGFTVEPMSATARCTPQSVAAHMLYENANPRILVEPGGHLDVSTASYTALDDRCVRVEGSRWYADADYTVKLEGARRVGEQGTLLALIRDAYYLEHLEAWIQRLEQSVWRRIQEVLPGLQNQLHIEYRLIGRNATLGMRETCLETPAEVGVLLVVTAPERTMVEEVLKLANPMLLHLPLGDESEMPTFAFPYSPAESYRGEVFEFCLNHVFHIDDPLSVFRLELT